MEDTRIVELLWQRSEQGLRELSTKYHKLCMRIATNILKDEMDAQECVNDAYLGVWNTVPPQRPNPLRTYLCRITRNLALARYRKNTAQKRNSYYDVTLDELSDVLPCAERVEDACEAEAIAAAINVFLATLSTRDRCLFVYRYWFSDSVAEIAKRFEMSPHAVSVRLFRIRQRLKNDLIERGINV